MLQETLNFVEEHTLKTEDRVCDRCGQFENSVEHMKADKISATSTTIKKTLNHFIKYDFEIAH
ncbi:MAG: hypothetical protein IPL46_18795 [Saprospiraceae bacterium]|nr:hypothetical protein [Saprospiraceae bacterium]